jgi:phosphate transport system permease protein
MTDTLDKPNTVKPKSLNSEAAQKRLAKRNAAEKRFRFYGQAAITIAVSFLVLLIASIAVRAAPGFTKHYLTIESPPRTANAASSDAQTLANINHLNDLIQADLQDSFPEAQSPEHRKILSKLTSRLSVLPIVTQLEKDPSAFQNARSFKVAISDDIDLYLKGGITGRSDLVAGQAGRLSQDPQGLYSLSDAGPDGFPDLKNRLGSLDLDTISLLIRLNETWYRAVNISGAVLKLEYLTGPRPIIGEQNSQPVYAKILWQGPENRALSDLEIAWAEQLDAQRRISQRVNWDIITSPDSNYPELAGAGAAIVGSLFTMIITALFALPIGILAAIYLEEFARKNVLTNVIEVNINNLAAVPSIIFGLLGAAVFLNIFGMPRSAPLVGGLVLGLLVLPTIIIASRAALKSIPPSIRTAALGLGASKTQTVFHHVLPLAAPGIFTGAIIAMARALGETAPLLLIGMVAFVNSVPTSPTEESTALPVLIFKWFNGAERAWDPMTSAVILILLAILIMMNLVAIILRRRFERRW